MFELLEFTFKDLLNPEFYIQNGGLWLFLFIVFAETGLFAGFFLPGDSLLFVAGIYSSELAAEVFDTGNEFLNLMLIVLLVVFAGVLGNTLGYWFGAKSGPYLFKRKDTFFFKKKHLYTAKEFYDKHGGGAIIFARFLPIIRTFAPIVAGIVGMDKKKFSFYNIVGCIAWAISMLFAGHYLYKFFLTTFDIDIKKHLELIVLGIVLVTTAPVIIRLITGSKKHEHRTDDISENKDA
jgi:membrane-associated protein